MRQNARTLPCALKRTDDVQQIGVVALLGRRHAEGLKTIVRIVQGIETGAPAFVGKGRIGDNIIKSLECVPVLKLGIR